MATFMIRAPYTGDGFKGMVTSPSDREAGVRNVIEAVGASLENVYFSVSTGEAIVILSGTSQQMAALGMAVMSSGALGTIECMELLNTNDMTAAMETASQVVSTYRAPNQ